MAIDKVRLEKAIAQQKLVRFSYQHKIRVVEPYHYGYLGGTEQLHCFQITGDSQSGGIPQWRNFHLTEIKTLSIIPDSHFDIRQDYNPDNSHYSSIEKKI